ncbi:MAG: diacylglycerol kinase [Sphingobacteriales bacterium]|jgi:diacylglycerol kinase
MKEMIFSFKCALNGLKIGFKREKNLRRHLLIVMLTSLLCMVLNLNSTEWAIVVICFGMVIATEYINSAIEKLADHVTSETHPAIKVVKDIAAGAVLVTSICAVIIAIIIILPKLIGALS